MAAETKGGATREPRSGGAVGGPHNGGPAGGRGNGGGAGGGGNGGGAGGGGNGGPARGPGNGGAPDPHEGGRGIRDQIERYRTAFIAVVVMILVAAGSAGYILAHERLAVPAWVPIVGRESFVLEGEFSTAQAVTPGQGQSVTIAGAKIGEIASVELRDGRALVSMNLTPKYARYIYRDATALLRPKTGLKDETVEITPGRPSSGRVAPGYTIPIAQTSPDGNLEEFLDSFDAETRAALQELLAGAAEGLNGNAANLSATLKRFAPLAREFSEIGREVAKRQYYVEHGIHNFRLLLEALGSKDTKLAAAVASGNAVFAVFSREDRQVQETLRELPGVLSQANHGFDKLSTAVRVTGHTLHALEPFATALAPAQRAARASFAAITPILRNEVRPLFRQILPVLQQLQPSLKDFADASPQLTTAFTVINEFFNELNYNPGPGQAGFAFFADWAAHDLNSVVAQGDAHGSEGQTLVYFNCAQVPLLHSVAAADPTAGLVLGLLNPPSAAQCQAALKSNSAAATAASRATGVSADALLADRVFGQGPDALALVPAGSLGGHR
jgi:phospholipid/cholesterol/gamma-HCH transport system substrate-binding protein